MVDSAIRSILYGEKSQDKADVVIHFVLRSKPPTIVLTDSGRAAYYYRLYTNAISDQKRGIQKGNDITMQTENDATTDDSIVATKTQLGVTLPEISGPYFLYLWLCMREPRPTNVNMRQYSVFNNETIRVDKLSYRLFTQIYADPITYSDKLNVHYTCFFKSTIYHRFPISLRSLLDRIQLVNHEDTLTLTEGDLTTIKSRPNLMEDPSRIMRHNKSERDVLIGNIDGNIVASNHRYTTIESKENKQHNKYVKMMSLLTDSMGRAEADVTYHCFSLPSREMNFYQILHWVNKRQIRHYVNSIQQCIVLEGYISEGKCEMMNKVLDSNKCYDNGDYEVYRLKGDIVLEITISSNDTRDHLWQRVLEMYNELDHNIQEEFPDPMDLGGSDIATLRATNSIAFDGMYCRKAPPRVQPIVIKESQVREELDKEKMILIYEGRYYTTKDKQVSNGADFVGMVNKFGDYDPNKPYNPIIRTYKKNHLLSKTFKEFKAYLLRYSTDPNYGFISRSDLLLPKHLEYLYNKPIFNPSADIAVIHTKKTIVSNSSKVSTGEVPDYIKTILGTSNIRRIITKKMGTGLLEVCGVSAKDFLIFAIDNNIYKDTMSLTIEMMEKDIGDGNVDHRLYGKLIEEYTGCSIIVFNMDGLVPYRYSKLSKNNYKILFMSTDGTYDTIAALPQRDKGLNLASVRDMVNSSTTLCVPDSTIVRSREVDYTLVMLKIVCYISRICEQMGVGVRYMLIPETSCKNLVENVYGGCIYYDCIISNTGSKFLENMVIARKSTSVIKKSIEWLRYISRGIIAEVEETTYKFATVLSPVDMSKYNLWNIDLEDCLYNNTLCYKLQHHEEIQQVRL
jgi:hypothetical protein